MRGRAPLRSQPPLVRLAWRNIGAYAGGSAPQHWTQHWTPA